jgi:hypothetical protein
MFRGDFQTVECNASFEIPIQLSGSLRGGCQLAAGPCALGKQRRVFDIPAFVLPPPSQIVEAAGTISALQWVSHSVPR